jgi:hypothetical protein
VTRGRAKDPALVTGSTPGGLLTASRFLRRREVCRLHVIATALGYSLNALQWSVEEILMDPLNMFQLIDQIKRCSAKVTL